MSAAPAIRVIRFQCVRVGLDASLRMDLIPQLQAKEGLLGVVAGRKGPDELGSRLVASVWTSSEAMATAHGAGAGPLPGLTDPLAAADVELEDLTVQILFQAQRTEEPGIVRALRGRVRPGELAAYIEDARNGTWSDSDSGGGPLALYLATPGSDTDEFLTVSTWRDWSSIEKATGGDIHRPLATRHPERIVDFEVALYEAISL